MHLSLTCSFVPSASSASAIFCSGSSPTPSSILPRHCGRTSIARDSMRRSSPTARASGALAAPASSFWRPLLLLPTADFHVEDARHHGIDGCAHPARRAVLFSQLGLGYFYHAD